MLGRFNCVAVDNSRTSEDAFQWYIRNYHRPEDTALLLHIHQMPHLPNMGLLSGAIAMTEDYRISVDKSVKHSKKVLSHYKRICNENNIRYKIALEDDYHSPGHMICDSAKSHDVDVIIVGQNHFSAITRILSSTTSDYVLHHSNVPVIVVPPPCLKRGSVKPEHDECKHIIAV